MRKITCILFLVMVSICGNAKTIWVGPNHSISTIKAGLMMAADGDTIFVEPGRYREQNLVISRSVHLVGLGRPVLDGENKYEIVSVKANAVFIEGFRMIHSGVSSIEDLAGIKVYNSRDVVIRNNILEGTFFGIYVQYGINCTIEKNLLTAQKRDEQQTGNGIHCWKSDSMRIIANSITNHRDGIYFEFVTNSIIWRNTAEKNLRYGLHFMFSNNDSYITNIFKNNGAGVAVMFSKGVKMFHNYFDENWGDGAYGLLLKEISDSHIGNNKFTRNTIAVYMEGVSRVHFEKNAFENNGWAMKIQASCMDVEVVKNNFIGNSFDVGTNGNLVLNTFNGNYWDKYEGYDINKDNLGDIPYRPVSLFAMIIEKNPPSLILFRSFMASLLDKTEKIIPTLTPIDLKDDHPLMKALPL